MIDFNRSIRTVYTSDFGSTSLTNDEKLLLVVAKVAHGVVGEKVLSAAVKKAWPKTIFRIVYHQKFYYGAEGAGWIDRNARGYMSLTDAGLQHLHDLLDETPLNPLTAATELLVFSARQAHDFDALLRTVLSSATTRVRIADSYIDETIFDTLLNEIPSSVRVELMYNHNTGTSLHERVKRFKVQYPNFHYSRYSKLHDRYLIIDDIGFIIGPSLKDAAVNSPAIIVRIGSDQSLKLVQLFDNTFKNLTKIT